MAERLTARDIADFECHYDSEFVNAEDYDRLRDTLDKIAKVARRNVEWASEHNRPVTDAEMLVLADWAERALNVAGS